ncbi:uncharacterized protein LOC121987931 [Zingiber officinale]|uniref:uncharacterized protein LOC121987931 n=1 Tax=Zingiber officinale TaxID=94328 RepID=UPI001C4C4FC9|nr:uncharacterized protein LOC121987931 [Zingiber officinale]
MALLSSAAAPPSTRRHSTHFPFLIRRHRPNTSPPVSLNFTGAASRQTPFLSLEETGTHRTPHGLRVDARSTDSHLCEQERLKFDWWGSLSLGEAVSDDELWAAVRLRVRTFYKFNESFGIEDYKTYVTKREFDGLQDRIVGRTPGYNAVACINATLPVSTFGSYAEELCSLCKFSRDGEEHIVVGTLDVNWCLQLPDELTGIKPEGIGVDLTRAYISNVCVAEELQRNGLGYALISKSKQVALSWGITDLYVHVVVGNEGARKLYDKSGFVYESEEPTWRARFLGRPRRFLLWANLR